MPGYGLTASAEQVPALVLRKGDEAETHAASEGKEEEREDKMK
jgi:hypothetical protein